MVAAKQYVTPHEGAVLFENETRAGSSTARRTALRNELGTREYQASGFSEYLVKCKLVVYMLNQTTVFIPS